ncbi:MAG: 2,3,4,5-tetrahydropyridine-2,6-dicarboxylate N-succinyltransferase [Holosporales bacterium]
MSIILKAHTFLIFSIGEKKSIVVWESLFYSYRFFMNMMEIAHTLNDENFANAHPDYFDTFFTLLDEGKIRVCEKKGEWIVHEWVKASILAYFKSVTCKKIGDGFDKISLKTTQWDNDHFTKAGFRLVPGSIVRKGAYIAPSVIVMPSFINVGAYIDEGTMIDSLVTVGSCAQIGKKVHISSNVVIGGVLEPVQAKPVIIEDHCFIGAGSSVLEGMIIETGAVIGAGVSLSATTKILDRQTGEILYGRIPAHSVVVPGSYPSTGGCHLACAVIVKKVDEKTREKTAINDLLRD